MKDIRMSKKELDQIIIFESIIKGELNQQEAAEILNLSARQIRRKLIRYLKEGKIGLAHKGRGRAGNRRIPPEIEGKIIELIMTVYVNYGPTLIAEKLAKNHQINVDHETIRRMMIRNGLRLARQRKLKIHVRRERKAHFGELVQVDGSYHQWFNNQYSTLIAFIDDATELVELMFADHETTKSLIEITRTYLNKYGRPRALYADGGRVYRVNTGKNRKERMTQYKRMLTELNIELIPAYCPQAKGRVERLFKTLQDRLVKELALQEVKTIEDANKYLKESFISEFNEKFARAPKNNIDLHGSLEEYNINSILCIKENRILNNDRTVSYNNRLFLLEKKQPIVLYRGSKIEIRKYMDGTISLALKDHNLNYKEIELPYIKKREKYDETKLDRRTISRKQAYNHPWRNPGLRDTSNELKIGHS